MTDTDLEYRIGQGASALDQQQELDRLDGWAVVSGLAVSPGDGLEVDVDSGTALLGLDGDGKANVVDVSADSIELDDANDEPRKDVIYTDPSGELSIESGEPRSALPEGNARFSTFRPEPASMHDVDGAVLAEVWVDADATDLTTSDIRDRRRSATTVHEQLVADSVDARSINAHEEVISDKGDFESLSTEELVAKNAALSKDNVVAATLHRGDNVTIETDFETIFDYSDPVDVLGGVIHGPVPDEVRVTWDDDSTTRILDELQRGKIRNGDSDDEEFTVIPIVPLKDVKKLEFTDASNKKQDHGWHVRTI